MPLEYDKPLAEYLELDALGSSTAHRAITESPFHAKYWQTNRDNSHASDVGTIAHQILLEGHEDGVVIIEADDWRTNAAKDCRRMAYECGKTPILKKHISGIREMVKAARTYIEQTEIAGVFGTGHAEVTVTWDEQGLPCKARPDYLTKDWHISLKTTGASAEPSTFSRRSLTTLGYDFSLAFYKRGLAANGIDVEHRILTVEQSPPYGCSLMALAPSKAAIADADVERAIAIWRKCVQSGSYPGYGTQTFWAEAMPYELAAAEDRELQYMMTGVSA